MTQETFQLLERYMHSCCADSAHDDEHIYRVLYNALQIARSQPGVDYDILITACLLHDIGRREQLADPKVCHAQAGAQKAYDFLTEQGFSEDFAQQVRHCIQTHRFRKALPPQTPEARILFDADKLDVTGAIGIARTLLYHGTVAAPLYTKNTDGTINDGTQGDENSFFREYKFKLETLYSRFLTEEGAQLARQRREAASRFYENLYAELSQGYTAGQQLLADLLSR